MTLTVQLLLFLERKFTFRTQHSTRVWKGVHCTMFRAQNDIYYIYFLFCAMIYELIRSAGRLEPKQGNFPSSDRIEKLLLCWECISLSYWHDGVDDVISHNREGLWQRMKNRLKVSRSDALPKLWERRVFGQARFQAYSSSADRLSCFSIVYACRTNWQNVSNVLSCVIFLMSNESALSQDRWLIEDKKKTRAALNHRREAIDLSCARESTSLTSRMLSSYQLERFNVRLNSVINVWWVTSLYDVCIELEFLEKKVDRSVRWVKVSGKQERLSLLWKLEWKLCCVDPQLASHVCANLGCRMWFQKRTSVCANSQTTRKQNLEVYKFCTSTRRPCHDLAYRRTQGFWYCAAALGLRPERVSVCARWVSHHRHLKIVFSTVRRHVVKVRKRFPISFFSPLLYSFLIVSVATIDKARDLIFIILGRRRKSATYYFASAVLSSRVILNHIPFTCSSAVWHEGKIISVTLFSCRWYVTIIQQSRWRRDKWNGINFIVRVEKTAQNSGETISCSGLEMIHSLHH